MHIEKTFAPFLILEKLVKKHNKIEKLSSLTREREREREREI